MTNAGVGATEVMVSEAQAPAAAHRGPDAGAALARRIHDGPLQAVLAARLFAQAPQQSPALLMDALDTALEDLRGLVRELTAPGAEEEPGAPM